MAEKKEKKRSAVNNISKFKPDLLLSQFEELAERFKVKIIYGKGNFNGGACHVLGQKYIVINKVKPEQQQLHILATEFHKLGLESVFVVPALRSFIEQENKKIKQT
jgi:hypothetical protein